MFTAGTATECAVLFFSISHVRKWAEASAIATARLLALRHARSRLHHV